MVIDMGQRLRPIIRELDYRQTEEDLDRREQETITLIESGSYDFSSYSKRTFTRNGKRRDIYSFDTLSTENILCHYLKKEIDKAFHVKYASRSKIMKMFFNTLPAVKDMNDFVIIRADFRNFFNSILTGHVFNEYLKESSLRRADKYVLEKYVEVFQFCYAGLCLSNEMAEIVCRDFDRLIKAKLEQFGVFFYERYVDDMLIMLKSYVDKDVFLRIFNDVVKEVFGQCPVELSMDPGKFSYITCRDLQKSASPNADAIETISFLGYEFYIHCDNDNKIYFNYGISQKKRDRYEHKIEAAFIDYRKNGDIELFRQRLKIFSARVVIPRSLGNKRIEWLTNGITSNYDELRYHLEDIETDTLTYLQEVYKVLFDKYKIAKPYFMKGTMGEESIYNLYSNLKRNRSVIFDKKIGVRRDDLVNWIRKLEPAYTADNKRYYQIVMEYLEMLEVKTSTISEEMVLSETV